MVRKTTKMTDAEFAAHYAKGLREIQGFGRKAAAVSGRAGRLMEKLAKLDQQLEEMEIKGNW